MTKCQHFCKKLRFCIKTVCRTAIIQRECTFTVWRCSYQFLYKLNVYFSSTPQVHIAVFFSFKIKEIKLCEKNFYKLCVILNINYVSINICESSCLTL